MQARAPQPGDADPVDSEQATRALAHDEQVELGPQASADAVLKASLLAGTGAKIGKFHVLQLLGEGGMGMVFAAYDVELDRKVAIKLLRGSPGEGSLGRARLLREAQALARLSHPNVVTVYEVGEIGGQVFIAMEFVLGDTLHRWLRKQPRTWREVVEVFVAAGRGLAVAHAARILHRDFKPANVLIGADGRARVLDFGLALAQGRADAGGERDGSPSLSGMRPPADEALTEAGSILGTPAYMAPERFIDGRPIDARSDQYSFCVALHEGLYGKRPFTAGDLGVLRAQILGAQIPEPPKGTKVPQWLRKVLLRGLAREPADRWPDMDALLRELLRDPQQLRRRALVGVGVGVVLLAGGYALAQATAQPLACPDARARLGWDAARPAVERAFLGPQASYAGDTWTRVAGDLDRYAERWAAGHREACEARASGQQSEAQVDLRMACLERRRGEFTALVARLGEADAQTVRVASAAVDGLPDPGHCANVAALRAAVPLPDDPELAARIVGLFDRLAEARAAISTRKLAASDELIAEVMRGVEAVDFPPLRAATLVARGELEDLHGDYEAARATLTDALWLADAVRDDDLVSRAMAGIIVALGDRMARFDEALAWRPHAHAVITRLGEGSPGHTRLLRAFATVLSVQGHDDDAARIFAEALRLDEAAAEVDERAVVQDLKGLGTSESKIGRQTESRALLERALALFERVEGPSHPDIAALLNNLAGTLFEMGEIDRARGLYERSLQILEQALGPDHAELSTVLANLGSMHADRGELDPARALLERSLAIDERALGPEHPELAMTLHFLAGVARARGDLAGARPHLERALKICERHFPPDSRAVLESRAELGILAYEQRRHADAIREFNRVLATLAAEPDADPELAAQTRYNLAEALRASGKRAQALPLARQALADYRQLAAGEHAPSIDENIAELEAWLAGKPAK